MPKALINGSLHFAACSETEATQKLVTQNLACALKRQAMRMTGARLDDAFVSMAPDVIDEASVESVFLSVEGRKLQGVRYQGLVYRKVDAFKPDHRLQAYCLAQTLTEQSVSYLMTRSEQRFVVWAHY